MQIGMQFITKSISKITIYNLHLLRSSNFVRLASFAFLALAVEGSQVARGIGGATTRIIFSNSGLDALSIGHTSVVFLIRWNSNAGAFWQQFALVILECPLPLSVVTVTTVANFRFGVAGRSGEAYLPFVLLCDHSVVLHGGVALFLQSYVIARRQQWRHEHGQNHNLT